MKPYDYLIVGAGLFGAVFARQMTDAGKRCMVIDKRHHIGGNCATEIIEGITVHKYGPHIFHTSSEKVWAYVNRFTSFNNFTYRPRVRYGDRLFSFPVNLLTLYQLWGVKTPAEAFTRLEHERMPDAEDGSMKGAILAKVGREVYETFYEGYTTKQWGRDPSKLPASLAARVPIRMTFDDNYFNDTWQGIPVGSYTAMIRKLLDGVQVVLGADYLADKYDLDTVADKVVYTGEIDRYFGYAHGQLEYRSLRFDHEVLDCSEGQGVAAVNYTSANVPYTRIIEHRHFLGEKSNYTVMTKEFPITPGPNNEPFYPVGDDRNLSMFAKYKAQADTLPHVIFGGRLASYQYFDMHQVVAQALHAAEIECSKITA